MAGSAKASRKYSFATPKIRYGGRIVWALEQDPVHVAPFGAILTANHWGKQASYDSLVEADSPVANRVGFGHVAFAVEDVESTLAEMVAAGGSRLGEVVVADTPAGRLTFVYARDPEGNVVELQRWG